MDPSVVEPEWSCCGSSVCDESEGCDWRLHQSVQSCNGVKVVSEQSSVPLPAEELD